MWSRKSIPVKPTKEAIALAEVHLWRLRLIYELNLRKWPDAIELKIDTGRRLRKFMKTRAYVLAEAERTDGEWHAICEYALSDDNVIYDLRPFTGAWSGDIRPPYDLWDYDVAQDAQHLIQMIKATIEQVRKVPMPT